jgi:hypothetical protein
MGRPKLDLTGQRFGRLVVLRRDDRPDHRYWLCQCDCGSPPKAVLQRSFQSGVTVSCGCRGREAAAETGRARLGRKAADLTGSRFGKLIVLSKTSVEAKSGKLRVAWDCLCDCGARKVVGHHELTRKDNKHTTSCGNHNSERAAARNRTHGEASRRYTVTPEYMTWCQMKRRCLEPTSKSWARYGGRGITVAPVWANSYEVFLVDVGRRPTSDHSLDRIDNNGNYEPGNVRWATKGEQARNRRSSRLLEIDGKIKTLAEWAELSGVHQGTINGRLKRGVPPAEAVFSPPKRTGRHMRKAA